MQMLCIFGHDIYELMSLAFEHSSLCVFSSRMASFLHLLFSSLLEQPSDAPKENKEWSTEVWIRTRTYLCKHWKIYRFPSYEWYTEKKIMLILTKKQVKLVLSTAENSLIKCHFMHSTPCTPPSFLQSSFFLAVVFVHNHLSRSSGAPEGEFPRVP